MSLIVQKFGGSSLATIERIKHVADIVRKTRLDGHDVVVVVSAMQGDTDRLIGLAYSTTATPNSREYDALVSTGEQVSAAILSMVLNAQQCSAKSMSAWQAGIKTEGMHKRASVDDIDGARIQSTLHDGHVVVVTGFQAINTDADITTLGRGGSDLTAVALAAALKADECQIFTDVNGIYTTDPNVVDDARRLEHISFDEMLELSALGAKVLQRQAVEYANRHHVPLRVLSTFRPDNGTLITHTETKHVNQPVVSSIAFDRNQAKLTVLGIPERNGVSEILDAVNSANIGIDMMIQGAPSQDSTVDFSFTVHLDDYQETFRITKQLADRLKAREVIGDDTVAKLSVIGLGMHSHAGVASKILQALDEESVRIHLITTSDVKISAVVDKRNMEEGARKLHAVFQLDQAS